MADRLRAQVSMEFVFLIVLGFSMFIVFSIVLREQTVNLVEKKQYILLKDAVLMVQTEINSAINLEDGYERTFFVPAKLDGLFDYDVSIEGDYVVGNITGNEFIAKIQPVDGNLKKGNNTIVKIRGALNLN